MTTKIDISRRTNFFKRIISIKETMIRIMEVKAIILKGLKKYTKIKLNDIPPIISPILSVIYNPPAVILPPIDLITDSEYGSIKPIKKAYGVLKIKMKKKRG